MKLMRWDETLAKLPGDYAKGFEFFLKEKLFKEGKEESSLENYFYDIKQYVEFLEMNTQRTDINFGASRDAALSYLAHLRNSDIKGKTFNPKVAALKSFFGCLENEGLVKENHWRKIKCKKHESERPAQYLNPILRQYILEKAKMEGIK